MGVVETLDELVSIYKLPELSLGTWKCTFLFSDVRDVLQRTMITHQILLRGAAQCYLLQTAMNLVDVVSWSFTQDTSFYESFSVNKCAKTCQQSRSVTLSLESPARKVGLALAGGLECGCQEGPPFADLGG